MAFPQINLAIVDRMAHIERVKVRSGRSHPFADVNNKWPKNSERQMEAWHCHFLKQYLVNALEGAI